MSLPPTQSPIPAEANFGKPLSGWRLKWYTVIFEADTRAGKRFDVLLIVLILASVAVVVLESVQSIALAWRPWLLTAEVFFTVTFTAEYLARLICVRRPWAYARSPFGIVDLLAVLPTYLAIFVPGVQALIDVRILRLVRIFRIFKLGAYVHEFNALGQALAASRRKILVFLCFVMMVVLVSGTLMYLIEGPENGFTSIPTGVYWAIVTMTTVGFGDITPKTEWGRLLASLQMLLGWGILAVPTGIVSAELTVNRQRPVTTTRSCQVCLSEGHDPKARYCNQCAAALPEYQSHT